MLAVLWLLAAPWLACTGAGPDDGEPDPTTPTGSTAATADTGSDFVPTGDLDADCVLHPGNALRFDCHASTSGLAITWTAWESTHPERVRRFESGPQDEHQQMLWGFPPGVSVHWRAEDAAGAFRTGAARTGELPDDLTATYAIEVDRAAAEVQGVMFAPACSTGFVHIVDRDGRIVWYQDMRESLGDASVVISAVRRTPEDTLLMLVGRSQVAEIDLTGALLLDLNRGVDFEPFVHHDVFRAGEHTYVPYLDEVLQGTTTFLVDGVLVFDGDGVLVDQFSIAGLWPLTTHFFDVVGYWFGLYPNGEDFSHANAVSVDANGDIVVSFRHLHTVAAFAGEPTSLEFGTLRWALVGHPSSVLSPGDFTATSVGGIDPEFSGQHDAHFADDGSMLLFDNRFAVGGNARGMRLEVDPVAGSALVTRSWDTGRSCLVQGAVRELPGGVLVTCNTGGHAMEFAEGEDEPRWHLSGNCGLARAVPWALWGP